MRGIPARSAWVPAILVGVFWLGIGAPATAASAAEEIAELKATLAALQGRLEQLEAQLKTTEETNDRQTDQIAAARASTGSWVQNYTLKGDFRYRSETIAQQGVPDRTRNRIRVRTGFEARVNDRVRADFMLSTAEGNDSRSPNQTLTNENSRKAIVIEQASAEWKVLPSLKLAAGKMKYPWERPGTSAFFDADIYPEGLAAMWSNGDLFGSAVYNILEERAAVGESTMTGLQAGWRPTLGAGRLILSGGYFDFHSVQHRSPYLSGSSYGNTTTNAGCIGGATNCLAYDYNLINAFAEYSLPVASRPLAVFVDFMNNEAAGNGLDTAWSAGLNFGKASQPRSWEVGYLYQVVQKDALFAQFLDSDLGNGNTDYRAHLFRMGFAVASNWVLNLTYQVARTQVDVPASVSGSPVASDRDYDRLHVDLNFKF